MRGWHLLAFMILILLACSAALIVVALLPPKQHDQANKLTGFSLVECTYQVFSDAPTYRRHTTQPVSVHKTDVTVHNQVKQVYSTNWAGYVVASDLQQPKRNTVTSVSGKWTVPRILPQAPVDIPRYCSIWVGLDGFKSAPVQQIGTASDWDPTVGAVVHYAWFKVHEQPPQMIVGFPVAAGDTISASVKLVKRLTGQFQMVLRNHNRSVAVVLPSTLTVSPHHQCSAASFVVEAPAEASSVTALADFGAVYFHECVCTVNGVLSAIDGRRRQFAPVHMLVHTDQPALTQTVAKPSPLSPDAKSFTVGYGTAT